MATLCLDLPVAVPLLLCLHLPVAVPLLLALMSGLSKFLYARSVFFRFSVPLYLFGLGGFPSLFLATAAGDGGLPAVFAAVPAL